MNILSKLGSLVKSTFFGLGLTLGASAALPTEAEAAKPQKIVKVSDTPNIDLDLKNLAETRKIRGDDESRVTNNKGKPLKKDNLDERKLKVLDTHIQPKLKEIDDEEKELQKLQELREKTSEENRKIREKNTRGTLESKNDSGEKVDPHTDPYILQKIIKGAKKNASVAKTNHSPSFNPQNKENLSIVNTDISIKGDPFGTEDTSGTVEKINKQAERRHRPSTQQKKSDPAKPLIIQIAGQNGKVIRKPSSPLPDTTNNRQNDTQMVENLELICKQENPELNTTNNKSREETTYQEPICESEESFTELTSRGEYKVTIKTSTRR